MAAPSVTTTTLDDQVTTAFEQVAFFALRSQPLFEMVADVRSTAQSHNGSGVQFTFIDDISQATSALTENADVTAVAITDDKVTVTLAEYGNAVITSAKVRGTSFLNVDADAANVVGYNMVDSLDKIVSNERLSHLEQFSRKEALLEIGCNVGTFLGVARDRGWRSVVGIEPNLIGKLLVYDAMNHTAQTIEL